jgi:hypothetical protein
MPKREAIVMKLWSIARAFVLTLTGAGIIAIGAERAVAANDVPAPSAAEQQAALATVPPKARVYYDHYWYNAPVAPDPYANWTPPAPPWQFCLND